MRMMHYLVKTDYLSGSWMRTKEESFAGVAAAAGALTHFRGKFSRGSWTRRCGSTLSSQTYTHISRTYLRLDMLAHSPESSDIPCEYWINCIITRNSTVSISPYGKVQKTIHIRLFSLIFSSKNIKCPLIKLIENKLIQTNTYTYMYTVTWRDIFYSPHKSRMGQSPTVFWRPASSRFRERVARSQDRKKIFFCMWLQARKEL